MELSPSPLPRPIAILDFETSGLSRFGYPIEVGFARRRGLDQPIESWTTASSPKQQHRIDGLTFTDACYRGNVR